MIFLKQTEENIWTILNEKKEVVDTITKDTVINYCKQELEENIIESLSPDTIIDTVWWEISDDYNLDLLDNYYQYWESFTAWFDYVCVEYFANEITFIYKQRLLKTK